MHEEFPFLISINDTCPTKNSLNIKYYEGYNPKHLAASVKAPWLLYLVSVPPLPSVLHPSTFEFKGFWSLFTQLPPHHFFFLLHFYGYPWKSFNIVLIEFNRKQFKAQYKKKCLWFFCFFGFCFLLFIKKKPLMLCYDNSYSAGFTCSVGVVLRNQVTVNLISLEMVLFHWEQPSEWQCLHLLPNVTAGNEPVCCSA